MRAPLLVPPYPRPTAAALLPLLLVAGCPATRTPPGPGFRAHRIPAEPVVFEALPQRLALYSAHGAIRVERGAAPLVRPTIVLGAADRAAAESLAGGCRFAVEASGPAQVVRLIPPAGCPAERLAVDYRVVLPHSCTLDLGTEDGIVDTSAYKAAALTLRTLDGTLRIGAVEGSLEFRSESGTVRLLGPFRKARGRTASGPVIVRLPREPARLDLETESGPLTLFLGEGAALELSFVTVSGRVRSDFPMRKLGPGLAPPARLAAGWRRERFSVGSGRPHRVSVRSRSGALRIRRLLGAR